MMALEEATKQVSIRLAIRELKKMRASRNDGCDNGRNVEGMRADERHHQQIAADQGWFDAGAAKRAELQRNSGRQGGSNGGRDRVFTCCI